MTACAVTPDGRQVVSASYDKTLKLWDLSSGTCRRTVNDNYIYPWRQLEVPMMVVIVCCRQLGNLDGLQSSLGNQASVLHTRGDLDGSIALHKEEERILRQLGNLGDLQKSLGNQAKVLQALGNLNSALALQKEKEPICRQLGTLNDLQASLGAQADILYKQSNPDGALALLKEQENICRQMGNLYYLTESLGNQAVVLGRKGKSAESRALAQEALTLAKHPEAASLMEWIKNINEWLSS